MINKEELDRNLEIIKTNFDLLSQIDIFSSISNGFK